MAEPNPINTANTDMDGNLLVIEGTSMELHDEAKPISGNEAETIVKIESLEPNTNSSNIENDVLAPSISGTSDEVVNDEAMAEAAAAIANEVADTLDPTNNSTTATPPQQGATTATAARVEDTTAIDATNLEIGQNIKTEEDKEVLPGGASDSQSSVAPSSALPQPNNGIIAATDASSKNNTESQSDNIKPMQERLTAGQVAAVQNAAVVAAAAAAAAAAVSASMLATVENPKEPSPVKKGTTKRIRRVGQTERRKVAKIDDGSTPSALAVAAAVAPMAATATSPAFAGLPDSIPRVLSKHDEKWNAMFEKLVEYKKRHKSTLVPQCYDQDPRLGRWVHYQRVEYWIYQQSGNGKITPERIARLEGIGFEWDPQRAQWNTMFKKLQKFKSEVGHCKVPKGYTKDPELANWVRNQRLEHANLMKNKKSRMTQDRFKKLDDLGFKWSTSIVNRDKVAAAAAVAAAKAGEAAAAKTTNSLEEPQKAIVKAEQAKPVETPTTAQPPPPPPPPATTTTTTTTNPADAQTESSSTVATQQSTATNAIPQQNTVDAATSTEQPPSKEEFSSDVKTSTEVVDTKADQTGGSETMMQI